jgi:hypothetical protein
MVGSIGGLPAGPVVNPNVRPGKQKRLYRDTREEMERRKGPVRQVLNRDLVVSPIALEQKCLELLQRTQHAITTIVTSRVYIADLRQTLGGHVLRQHEWQIAVELREITELMLELAGFTGASAGPMTNAVLVPQKRAILIARDATAARVIALESLAKQIEAADVAHHDWETAQQLAANNDKYLDLVARTAADRLATVEIAGLAEQAAAAAQAFRETLQQATLAAQALALPEPQSKTAREKS